MGPIQPVSHIEPITVHLVDRTSDRQANGRQFAPPHREPPPEPEEFETETLSEEEDAIGSHLDISA